jgi:peroxiredoxin (alkyl hydroperoxide reductase subunit C)
MKPKINLLFLLIGLSFSLNAQNIADYRIPLLGESAPAFKAESTKGMINFPEDYFGNWKIIFSHPADFTPVCTSEILTLASMQEKFKELNAVLLVVSTDGINSHIEWINSIQSIDYNNLGLQKVDFPLISDGNLEICKKYGMVEANSGRNNSIRGVFIIDPDDKVSSINFYSASTGRNLDEIYRTLVALQTSEKYNVLTPANWQQGQEVLIPSPSTIEEAQKLKSKNDPDLRMITWYFWLKKL